jgi:hypothetical protein
MSTTAPGRILGKPSVKALRESLSGRVADRAGIKGDKRILSVLIWTRQKVRQKPTEDSPSNLGESRQRNHCTVSLVLQTQAAKKALKTGICTQAVQQQDIEPPD